jgi:hypothetical protein
VPLPPTARCSAPRRLDPTQTIGGCGDGAPLEQAHSMTVLVAGGAGSHMVQTLVNAGERIVVLDISRPASIGRLRSARHSWSATPSINPEWRRLSQSMVSPSFISPPRSACRTRFGIPSATTSYGELPRPDRDPRSVPFKAAPIIF